METIHTVTVCKAIACICRFIQRGKQEEKLDQVFKRGNLI